MRRKITRTTAIAFSDCFTTRLKAAIFAPAKRTFIAWPKSANLIIDQCVEQGVPFAREYGGLLANRSFGGAQVSRTFYARGQTGQQFLLGCLPGAVSPDRRGQCKNVSANGNARPCDRRWTCQGDHHPQLGTGQIEQAPGDAVVLATGGYGNVFYLSTNASGCNVTATMALTRKGALFANPCFTQIHPTCIPVSGEHQSKLTLMSRIAAQRRTCLGPKRKEDRQTAGRNTGSGARLLPRAKISELWQPRAARYCFTCGKEVCDEGRGVGPGGRGVYLDFADAIKRLGEDRIRNATAICLRFTKRSPAKMPTKCRCGFTRQYTTPWVVSGWITI